MTSGTSASSLGILTADKLKQLLKTVSEAALFIEELLAATGVGVAFDMSQAEKFTAVLANLAAVAIEAAHESAGKEITPASVMELLPVSTPLAPVNANA